MLFWSFHLGKIWPAVRMSVRRWKVICDFRGLWQCIGCLCLKCAQNEVVQAETLQSPGHPESHQVSVIMHLFPDLVFFIDQSSWVPSRFLPSHNSKLPSKGHVSCPLKPKVLPLITLYWFPCWLVRVSELCQGKDVQIEMSSQINPVCIWHNTINVHPPFIKVVKNLVSISITNDTSGFDRAWHVYKWHC